MGEASMGRAAESPSRSSRISAGLRRWRPRRAQKIAETRRVFVRSGPSDQPAAGSGGRTSRGQPPASIASLPATADAAENRKAPSHAWEPMSP